MKEYFVLFLIFFNLLQSSFLLWEAMQRGGFFYINFALLCSCPGLNRVLGKYREIVATQ